MTTYEFQGDKLPDTTPGTVLGVIYELWPNTAVKYATSEGQRRWWRQAGRMDLPDVLAAIRAHADASGKLADIGGAFAALQDRQAAGKPRHDPDGDRIRAEHQAIRDAWAALPAAARPVIWEAAYVMRCRQWIEYGLPGRPDRLPLPDGPDSRLGQLHAVRTAMRDAGLWGLPPGDGEAGK